MVSITMSMYVHDNSKCFHVLIHSSLTLTVPLSTRYNEDLDGVLLSYNNMRVLNVEVCKLRSERHGILYAVSAVTSNQLLLS